MRNHEGCSVSTRHDGVGVRTYRRPWRLLASAVVVGAVATTLAAWAQPVFGPAQDPLAGSRVFGTRGCARCHAVHGLGGAIGPDLGRVARPRSFYDLATAMWNHLPKMAGRMEQLGIPRARLDAQEAGDLVAFLFTLNYFDPPGNPATGRRWFTEKRCVVCHQVGGVGGVVGPDLDHLQVFGSPLFVASALWNHGPQMAEAMRARGIERPTFTGAELRDLIAFLAPATAGPREGPVYMLPGRADEGRRLFVSRHCVECHAIAGRGGRLGPDLAERGVRHSLVEFAAAMWNKAPAMTAAMKVRGVPIPQLRPEEMADLVAYLYSVGYFLEPGDARRGWQVATAKGCLACHAAGGERGKPASDLSRVRGLDSPAGVLAALWNHAVVTAPVPSGRPSPWPEFRASEMADLVAMLRSLGRSRP